MGVHTFVPEEVYPVQRENHATGRQKRNHPTTTVYIVRYRAEDGSGYQYKYESGSVESTAQNILKVDMKSIGDEIAYAVEGEGEWGENIGFVIKNDSVVYVGADYLEHMENA